MWTLKLFSLFVFVSTGISTLSAASNFEDAGSFNQNEISNDFQEEHGYSFTILNFEIECFSQNYLRQKQRTVNTTYRFKYNLPIVGPNASSIIYLEYSQTIVLKLPGHSISYPFSNFP